MANVEINDLTPKAPVDTDEFEGQVTDGGVSFKMTRAEILGDADNTADNETSHADVLVDNDAVSPVNGANRLITETELAASGDMRKSVYDTNANGVVDDAERVNNLTVETAVPLGAAFTDTIYDDTGIQAEVDLNTTHRQSAHAPADADNTAANETSHADVLVDDDVGSVVQGYDAATAKTDVAQEYTATQNFNATTLTDGASIAWDAAANQVASVTLAGNRTLANPTNMKDGATYILTVKQDATGSRTLAYGSAYKWPGGTAPVLSTAANAVDILTFVCDGTNMYGVASLDFS